MKLLACLSRVSALVLVLFLAAGCEEDSANGDPVGPDVSGDWSGRYYFTDGSVDIPISAKIAQNERSTFIETTLPAQGRLLTGSLNGAGEMFMTDALDGETWTTYFGPVTANHVQLADYAYGAGSSTFRIIDLRK